MATRVGGGGEKETRGRCGQWPPSCKRQEVLGIEHHRVIVYCKKVEMALPAFLNTLTCKSSRKQVI